MSQRRELTTVDGTVAKLGDRVWRVRGYGYPTLCKLTSHNIGWTHERYFASKQAANAAALADARRTLKKAQQEARTQRTRIARLKASP